MAELSELHEQVAAQAEELMSNWHESVERVAGEDGEPDTIVAREEDTVVAILPLDEETLDSMAEAFGEDDLASWLREELAEDAERESDEQEDDESAELEAEADKWLAMGDKPKDETDDFDLDDWDDPEADALIDELPA